MAAWTLLLVLAATSTQPTNPLIEYRRCLMGNRAAPKVTSRKHGGRNREVCREP